MMSSQANNVHLDPAELADYFAGLLSEDRESSIEGHFAECQHCTTQARRFHSFNQVWDRWTAQAHGEASWRAVLGKALHVTAKAHPHWRERLRHWRTHWAGKAEAAVRVVMEAPGKTSHVVTEGLEALVRAGGRWQFGRAPGLVPTRGGQLHGPATPSPATVALAPGKSKAWVAVSGEDEVSVRVEEWPAGQPAPLVLLIPTVGTGELQAQELKKTRGATYLIARFEDIPPGEYVVAFEPVEDGH